MKYSAEFIKKLASLGKVVRDAPMRDYTTFKTGGPADIMIWTRGPAQVVEIIGLAGREGVPLTVIGGGSNLLVGDRGIRGLVMRFAGDGGTAPAIEMRDGTVRAEAGASKEDLIAFALGRRLGGIEFMAGIPGCVGGGICMNAGTNLGNFAGVLGGIEIVTGDGDIRTIVPGEGMGGYRNMGLPAGSVIIAGIFNLPADPEPDRTSAAVNDLVADRRKKHPLQYPSAGSVFKNPEGHASWKLINDAGLRGRRLGGAAVSDLHTNFIVNADGATSSDIRALIEEVRSVVRDRFGVELEPEVRMLGEF